MTTNMTGRLLAAAGLAGLLLSFILLDKGDGRSTLSIISFAAMAVGYFLTQKGMAEDAASAHRIRVRVLGGARRMIEKDGKLDDSRLAAILGLPVSDVTKYVDFGMNRGWLPMDPADGVPTPEMGCLIVDVLKKPFTFQLFGKPVLMIDSDVFGRDYGSYLVTLMPGPHRISVKTTHRRQNPGGIGRMYTKETGHSVLIKEDCISGVQFSQALSLFSGGKFMDY